jgi:hypothetical protein
VLAAAVITGLATVMIIMIFRKMGTTSPIKVSVKDEARPKMEQQRKATEERERRRADYQRYLKRLEELKSQGRISEKTYERLRKEYKLQIKERDESPLA